MRFALTLALAAIVAPGVFTGLELTSDWHTSPSEWSESRVFHRPFDPAYESRIELGRFASVARVLDWQPSTNGAYRFAVDEDDRMRTGPWDSRIWVFTERDYMLRLDLIDCRVARARWINEKLLYVEVWWGRVLGTYLVLDVEAERIVLREMVHDGNIPFQQHRQRDESGSGR